jgi:hypothetical protein
MWDAHMLDDLQDENAFSIEFMTCSWMPGEVQPEEEGRYIVMYRYRDTPKVLRMHVADWIFNKCSSRHSWRTHCYQDIQVIAWVFGLQEYEDKIL